MSDGHGGNLRELAAEAGLDEDEVLDFSANINPLGPPSWLRAAVSRAAEDIPHYPDPDYVGFRQAAASHHGITPDEIIPGNGTSDILWALPRALNCVRVLVPVPAYIDYARSARRAGLEVRELPMNAEDGFELDAERLAAQIEDGDLVFVGRPNNPTGRVPGADELRGLARRNPGATFVIDEAFINFAEGRDSLAGACPGNVIVLRSMTKFYAVPGLRVGYAVASSALAEKIRTQVPPWSLNCIAERVAREAVHDRDYAAETRRYVRKRRRELFEELDRLEGLRPYPSEANFLLVKLNRGGLDAATLQERLLQNGIAIRSCGNFSGLDERYFRVAVKTREQNERLLDALRSAMGCSAPTAAGRTSTPSLMVQGTSSSAGKTVLAAALCRILLQDGYRVAPFKAQNMSLNSFVTRGGNEMGRAQVLQAQACREEPDVRMNPILLKPTTDIGSQVIVRGQPRDNMNAEEYTREKSRLFPVVEECYESLASEYDVVVLEGAGSPSEINLKEHDIVNMNMARRAEAPVLLTGDIDRGGVFASFVGTMELLQKWERDLVRGFIVNRFRGDESLLEPALDYTERHTGKPVLGVVPYLDDLNLPDEDSVEFKSGGYDDDEGTADDAVTLAVIDLPHISNFTDFDAFRLEPDVELTVVRRPEELRGVDAVVIPGSKNVLADLEFLRDSGLAAAIADSAANGNPEIVGLCAGLQMLGREIADPHRIESDRGGREGLDLLAVRTVLAPSKTLTQVEARHEPSGLPVRGYEIHHGETDLLEGGPEPAVTGEDGSGLGYRRKDRPVWGSYLHGIFDADEFRRWFINRIRERTGLAPKDEITASYDLEPALDRLAAVVRERVDMDTVYDAMGLT